MCHLQQPRRLPHSAWFSMCFYFQIIGRCSLISILLHYIVWYDTSDQHTWQMRTDERTCLLAIYVFVDARGQRNYERSISDNYVSFAADNCTSGSYLPRENQYPEPHVGTFTRQICDWALPKTARSRRNSIYIYIFLLGSRERETLHAGSRRLAANSTNSDNIMIDIFGTDACNQWGVDDHLEITAENSPESHQRKSEKYMIMMSVIQCCFAMSKLKGIELALAKRVPKFPTESFGCHESHCVCIRHRSMSSMKEHKTKAWTWTHTHQSQIYRFIIWQNGERSFRL